MTVAEAKERIKEEFIRRFYDWLDDEKNLSDHDYGWKYGWGKGAEPHKDNLKGVMTFQKYMFCAYRLDDEWEKAGIPRQIIWQLAREGFLSEQMKKWKSFRFISQKTAKEIYKEYKSK